MNTFSSARPAPISLLIISAFIIIGNSTVLLAEARPHEQTGTNISAGHIEQNVSHEQNVSNEKTAYHEQNVSYEMAGNYEVTGDFEQTASFEVTGTLLDKSDAPIANHPLVLLGDDDSNIASGQSGSQGHFTLSYEKQPTSANPPGIPDGPTLFRLGSSYPNPFNPRTTIPFEAPENTYARIAVYNILGQRVVQTQSEISRGNHEIAVNLGGSMAQGQYILRIQGDGFSETVPMTYVSAGKGGGRPEISISSSGDIRTPISGNMRSVGQPGPYRLVARESGDYLERVIEIPAGQDYHTGPITIYTEETLLDTVQHATFQYFWDGAEPVSGMARERYHLDASTQENVVTTGGSGFGLMVIITGIERGFITREEGVARLERIIGFLEDADRFHGVWPHWLNGRTGQVVPFSPQDNGGDLVETSFMAQGLLTVRQYLRDGSENEQELAGRIDTLWREIEWNWHTKSGQENVLYWHWSPNYGWAMNHTIRGYDECLITYVLAASSPTHPISTDAYHQGWARGGHIAMEDHYAFGYALPLRHNDAEDFSGPLFWSHYSYLGLDPRGLSDRYADYWEHNRNHTLIHREYAIVNPFNYAGYGEDSWGLTASYSVDGYAAHRPYGDDRGVITPTAALSSFPYTPDESMVVLKNFYFNLGDKLFGKFGFFDAFSKEHNWFPQRYLAIDQGPIVVMIENHRSGLLWDLFMTAPEVLDGLERLEFESPHLQSQGN